MNIKTTINTKNSKKPKLFSFSEAVNKGGVYNLIGDACIDGVDYVIFFKNSPAFIYYNNSGKYISVKDANDPFYYKDSKYSLADREISITVSN